VAGTSEYGNESSVSIQWGEVLDKLKTGYLLKHDSAPCSKYIYSVPNVNTNDMQGGLRTFFVTSMYIYTVVLCLFDAIMLKALYEKEWFV